MNNKISLELFEEYEVINFYTLRFNGEDTEFDKFLDKFPEGCKYDDDIDIIIKWLEIIAERGALKRNFRPEGNYGDNLCAIPIETSNLRLYCLRISDDILILGNGGVKSTKTYNEDELLNSYAGLLQEIDKYIESRLRKEHLHIYNKKFVGNINFTIKGDEHEAK